MVTVTELVTRLQRRVIDLPSAVQAEAQTLVLEAHREIQELHNFKVQEGLATKVTTVGNQDLGTIGLGRFKDYRTGAEPFWTDDRGYTRFLRVSHDEDEVRRQYIQIYPDGQGPPEVLLHRAPQAVGEAVSLHHWFVFPIPDGLAVTATGEYTIRIPYWSYLLAPTTSDWLTDNATQFILNAATSNAFALNWDEARYQFWRARAYGPFYDSQGVIGGDLKRAISRDKQFMVSHVETLVAYPGSSSVKLGL